MKRIRLTIRRNPNDPVEDLKYTALVRRDLWAHSPVEVDPDNPTQGTHRDPEKNPYFELATAFPDEVSRILREYGHQKRVTVKVVQEEVGPSCENCGNTAPGRYLPTVCPVCHLRDIAPCPYCTAEVERQRYRKLSGDLFTCANCGKRVRLRINPDLFKEDGTYNEPIVLVEPAQG